MKRPNFKAIVDALMIAGLSLSAIGTANAACSTGRVRVAEVYEYTLNGATGAYVYVVPDNVLLPTFYWYFNTTNQNVMTQTQMALQNRESIYLTGDAVSCPTTGSARYGGILTTLFDY